MDTPELTLVPGEETVLLGQNGEVSAEEVLERVADGTRSAELEFEFDGRTRLLELGLLDIQRQSEGSLPLSARAAEVPLSSDCGLERIQNPQRMARQSLRS